MHLRLPRPLGSVIDNSAATVPLAAGQRLQTPQDRKKEPANVVPIHRFTTVAEGAKDGWEVATSISAHTR